MLFNFCTAAALLSAISNAQIFEPAEVLQFQSAMAAQFSGYADFRGPTGSVSVDIPAATPKVKSNFVAGAPYWLEGLKRQGRAAFNSNPSGYQVFRNVKDFGAKGDGQTDDTAAINLAISSGNRCGPYNCQSSTTTPAVVYFPGGTYLVSSSIVDYYYTQIIGNPNDMPVLKVLANFTQPAGNIGVIDGDPVDQNQNLRVGATNIFWRQIRNLIIDTTSVAASSNLACIHWPTGQATSLQNIVFRMNPASGTQQIGIYIEQGSGGFMNDLVFTGGYIGLNVGNQQFTSRNMTFNGVTTAVNQIWDWGWTYQGLNIQNCGTGVNFLSGGVGSITILDSIVSNTPVAFKTGRSASISPPTANSLVLENIKTSGVKTVLQNANGGAIIPALSTIPAYASGNWYQPNGPTQGNGFITPNSRPSSLLSSDGSKYYQRSKPQYETLSASSFLSARDQGAKGDGQTDDTAALQAAINNAKSQGKVLYIDHGDYVVTNTIYIPAGSKIVGESYPVILSSGNFFNNMNTPQPVVQIGKPGESGSIEWSDTIVSTRGQQQGAILFQFNLASPAGTPSGLWDVHARIGGFAGSNLQLSQCQKTPGTTITSSNLNKNCISGFLTMHITKGSSGLYLENVWLWVADHDVEDPNLTQITVYAGRGLLDESVSGPVWLVGTAVEHHQRYEYQFSSTQNVYMGQIQTETAYYQPNPIANLPFPYNSNYSDLYFPGPTTVSDGSLSIPNSDGVGLRIVDSQNIFAYGAGFYSFFNNYSTTCSNQNNGVQCQSKTTILDGKNTKISLYNLNTVGTHWPVTINGTNTAKWSDNQNGFIQTINLLRLS